jgi:hypothetical protein
MGAWGYSPFDSDEGMDSFDEFINSDNKVVYLENQINNLLQVPFEEIGDYADDALISAEMITGAKGHLSKSFYGEDYFEDNETQKPDFEELGKIIDKKLIEKAIKVVERIVLYTNENNEEWDEEDIGDWEKEMLDIKTRLQLSLASSL